MALLAPRITGDDVVDQWTEEVTYLINAGIVGAAATAAPGQEVIPVFATSEDGDDQSLNLGSRQFVYYATVEVGTQPELPLPEGTVFTQFRGEDARQVEITVHIIPDSFTNAMGVTQDYTDFDTLVTDWSIGAVEPEEFELDQDGPNFDYRTDTKMLMARIRENSVYANATLARSFDYKWSISGNDFDPVVDDVTTDFPFVFVQPEDIFNYTDQGDGRTAQFLCNVVQL